MEIERTKRGPNLEKRCWCSPNCTLFGNWVISRVLDVQMTSMFWTDSIRHRPTTFMQSPRFKKAVFKSKLQQQWRSLNLSCSPDTVQCSAHISSSRSPNDLNFFSWKVKTISYNFYGTSGSSSNVSNDVLFRQEYKNFHQVKSWPPTQQLVIKSIVPNFGL